jgi:hypothetical protein
LVPLWHNAAAVAKLVAKYAAKMVAKNSKSLLVFW